MRNLGNAFKMLPSFISFRKIQVFCLPASDGVTNFKINIFLPISVIYCITEKNCMAFFIDVFHFLFFFFLKIRPIL